MKILSGIKYTRNENQMWGTQKESLRENMANQSTKTKRKLNVKSEQLNCIIA